MNWQGLLTEKPLTRDTLGAGTIPWTESDEELLRKKHGIKSKAQLFAKAMWEGTSILYMFENGPFPKAIAQTAVLAMAVEVSGQRQTLLHGLGKLEAAARKHP